MRLDRLTQIVTAIDLHACGEPGRVIVDGVADVPGATMFEKMQHFQKHHDDLRQAMTVIVAGLNRFLNAGNPVFAPPPQYKQDIALSVTRLLVVLKRTGNTFEVETVKVESIT